MYSNLPKALHPLAGRTLLEHVYHTASSLQHKDIHIVYGYGGDRVKDALQDLPASWVEQAEQLGTGHAVSQAIAGLPDADNALILYGDTPLITQKTLQNLIDSHKDSALSLLTAHADNPAEYGRIIRDGSGNILRIVEEKDATEAEKATHEINTGIMLAGIASLRKWLNAISNDNKQGEYYLTDIVALAVDEGANINTEATESPIETHGINNRAHLAEIERYYQLVQAHHLMHRGVTLADPARFDLRGELEAGRDNTIDINTIMEGRLKLGHNVNIGPNCIIKDSIVGNNTAILANCVIENAIIGNDCRIGPFAHIRPDSTLDDKVCIGNFVEIKKSTVGKGTKISHLSYIGDSELGSDTNIGAGVITCNYDGADKHKTIIGNRVFVGSDVQLIAPVKVEDGATIAAGATITEDVRPNALAISRTEQKIIDDWKRPQKPE